MKMKSMLLLALSAMVLLSGCSGEENAAPTASTGGDAVMSESGNEYDKISVSALNPQYANIISGLAGTTWDGSLSGSATVDGVTHTWDISKSDFTYSADRKDEAVDNAEARKMADACVDSLRLGLDMSPDPETKKGENGSTVFTYTFTCKGIPIMGNKNVNLPGDTDNSPYMATGSYIEVTVVKSGIQNVILHNLLKIGDVEKSYEEKDLVNQTEIQKNLDTYYQQFENDGEKISTAIASMTVIYMPCPDKENGDQSLIPVYDIEVGSQEKDKREVLMDALTGFIYFAE